MIVVFEPLCEGREHSPFNAGIVQAAKRISPDGRVIFFAEPFHLEAVKECSDPQWTAGVEWRTIEIAPRHSKSFRERFAYARKVFNLVWATAEHHSAAAIICTAITEPGLAAVKVMLATARSTRPVGIVFHSGLSSLLGSGRGRLLLGRGNAQNLRLLVLGEHIRRYAVDRVPAVRRHLYSLPHPIAGWPVPATTLNPDLIRFGFLGLGNTAKGFPEFVSLAREYREERDAAKVVFEMVGRPATECSQLFQAAQKTCKRLVTAIQGDSQWPWELYRDRVASLSYALLPFDAAAYACTCSGSALDAIAAIKPMIVSDTPGFRELFDELGDIGYLCRDREEMRSVIASIANDPPLERYARQCENLARSRAMFEIGPVAARLSWVLAAGKTHTLPWLNEPGGTDRANRLNVSRL